MAENGGGLPVVSWIKEGRSGVAQFLLMAGMLGFDILVVVFRL